MDGAVGKIYRESGFGGQSGISITGRGEQGFSPTTFRGSAGPQRETLPNQLCFFFAFKPAPFVIVCCRRPGTPRQISRSVGGKGSV